MSGNSGGKIQIGRNTERDSGGGWGGGEIKIELKESGRTCRGFIWINAQSKRAFVGRFVSNRVNLKAVNLMITYLLIYSMVQSPS